MATTAQTMAAAFVAANLFGVSPMLASDDLVLDQSTEAAAYPEYFCTNRGVRVEVEKYSCLEIGGRGIVAKCDISLNNPMWRATDETCDFGITSEFLPVLAN
ncbi:MAG: hypothetical protein HKO04_02885 [Silicimonas sp.]|nr:hypothetical protein [Silicimonas sp.]